MHKNKLLVVVDVQNDFVDGVLGTPEARSIIPNIVNKIKNWNGAIASTFDTHNKNYLRTNEGKHLPIPHCIKGTQGWEQNAEVAAAIDEKRPRATSIQTAIFETEKNTFAAKALPSIIYQGGYDYIELVGLCTDICVVSTALFLKAKFPEYTIAVNPICCAGVTQESHDAALTTMKMCQIDITTDIDK